MQGTAHPVPHECPRSGVGEGRCPHRRLAMRLLLRPMPRHFSRCGAKRDAAMLRLQLGQTHSLLFHWLKTCPKMSNPGWSTISGDSRARDDQGGWAGTVSSKPCLGLQGFRYWKKSPDTLPELTKILHAVWVCVVQEKVATLDGPVHLEAEPQTRIFDQVCINLLSNGLGQGESPSAWLPRVGGNLVVGSGMSPILTQLAACTKTPAELEAHMGTLTSSLLLSRPDKDISSIFICKLLWRRHSDCS